MDTTQVIKAACFRDCIAVGDTIGDFYVGYNGTLPEIGAPVALHDFYNDTEWFGVFHALRCTRNGKGEC